jgi:hypothetical protein
MTCESMVRPDEFVRNLAIRHRHSRRRPDVIWSFVMKRFRAVCLTAVMLLLPGLVYAVDGDTDPGEICGNCRPDPLSPTGASRHYKRGGIGYLDECELEETPALIMASATPAADVSDRSLSAPEERGLGDSFPCQVAESRRCGERICRSWPPKNHRNFSVRVMLVTDTGDKVVYRGRSQERSRTSPSCREPTRGRHDDRSRCSLLHARGSRLSGVSI